MSAEPQGLLSRLPDEVRTGGPSWLVGLRRDAADRLRTEGFPTRKTEAWRFTPVGSVVEVPYEEAPRATAPKWVERHLGDDGAVRIIVVNGRPRLDRSRPFPAGVEVRSLREVVSASPEAAEPYLGQVAPAEPFARLSSALFEDGLMVRVRHGARPDRAIHVVHVAVPGETPSASYPRLLLVVDPTAALTLVETFLGEPGGGHLVDSVSEIFIGEGSVLDHTRVTEGVPGGHHVGTLAVRQARASEYRSRVVTLGGALSRLDLLVELAGDGAEARLEGIYHVNDGDVVDHHTVIDHLRPSCSSRESYRGIADGKGHAVFDGTVIVRPGAQHTDAHQENRNLLMSDDAAVHTKPHLEIDADDVKCSHGATVGSLDEDQLFYLRTRGIDEETSRAMLTFAFVRPHLESIPVRAVRRRLGEMLLARLPHGDALQELL